MTNQKKYVFINYISRSGSTYLCDLLSRYRDISVGIEAGFPGFPNTIMPLSRDLLHNEEELNTYLDELFLDVRFCEWKISREQIFNSLIKLEFPVDFKKILTTCLDCYFGESDDSLFRVHKSGYYLECIADVRRLFPNGKMIFVVRDPRAIFNSQQQAKSLYSTDKMGANIFSFILLYKQRIASLKKELYAQDFLTVFYEKLIDNPDENILEILDFIGVSNLEKKENINYRDNIPDNQKDLHTNVGSVAIKNNKQKWIEGLTKIQILLIERALADEMNYLNYSFSSPSLKYPFEKLRFARLYSSFMFYRFKRMILSFLM